MLGGFQQGVARQRKLQRGLRARRSLWQSSQALAALSRAAGATEAAVYSQEAGRRARGGRRCQGGRLPRQAACSTAVGRWVGAQRGLSLAG